jgi:hypothetical protein
VIRGVCDELDPPTIEVGVGHTARCHLYTEKQGRIELEKASAPSSIASA